LNHFTVPCSFTYFLFSWAIWRFSRSLSRKNKGAASCIGSQPLLTDQKVFTRATNATHCLIYLAAAHPDSWPNSLNWDARISEMRKLRFNSILKRAGVA
jgi:hypothetical protein